jgi:hypothetical protein
MGMFDTYEPDPPVKCPICGEELLFWQGKDGPCCLFEWRQHIATPVKWDVEEPRDLTSIKTRLPPQFEIITGCWKCGEPLAAFCECIDGVWNTIRLTPNDNEFGLAHDTQDLT